MTVTIEQYIFQGHVPDGIDREHFARELIKRYRDALNEWEPSITWDITLYPIDRSGAEPPPVFGGLSPETDPADLIDLLNNARADLFEEMRLPEGES